MLCSLIFDVENSAGTSFDVIASNGDYIGAYSYSALPLTIDLLSNDTGVESLTVCDMNSSNCCATVTFEALNCAPNNCEIFDLTAEPLPCDTSSGLFMIELDLEAVNSGMNFSVTVNGASNGTFSYLDLPITIGPFPGDGTTTWDIFVQDVTNPNCVADVSVGPVTCMAACELNNLTVETLECTSDETYSLILDLDYENTAGGFEVYSSAAYIGFFDYGALPITITDFPTIDEDMETIIVCDAMNSNCCTEISFEPLDCTPVVCGIDSLVVEPLGCDSLGEFYIEIDFVYENTATTFELNVNGNSFGAYKLC